MQKMLFVFDLWRKNDKFRLLRFNSQFFYFLIKLTSHKLILGIFMRNHTCQVKQDLNVELSSHLMTAILSTHQILQSKLNKFYLWEFTCTKVYKLSSYIGNFLLRIISFDLAIFKSTALIKMLGRIQIPALLWNWLLSLYADPVLRNSWLYVIACGFKVNLLSYFAAAKLLKLSA